VLYSAVVGNHTLALLVGWIPRLIDIQILRLSHYLVMFLFMAFVIHHVQRAGGLKEAAKRVDGKHLLRQEIHSSQRA
jgi:hypothetical protein